MRWVNRLLTCHRRAALLERARFCHARGLALAIVAGRYFRSGGRGQAFTYRQAALQHFRRRNRHLGEIRALLPRNPR